MNRVIGKIFILYRNKILNVSVPPGYLNGTNTKFYQLAWPSRPHLTLLALSAALGLNSTILVILFHTWAQIFTQYYAL